MKLYKVADAIEQILFTAVDQETGEISEEAALQLDALEMQRAEVASHIARYRQGELAEAMAVDVEIRRLLILRESHSRRAAWLATYLMRCIPREVVIEDPILPIKWKPRFSTKVIALDEKGEPDFSAIDDMYIRKKLIPASIEQSVDKAAALPELKKGVEIAGLTLDKKWSLVIGKEAIKQEDKS